MRLAEEGKLAYLIADSSISYGTNYPINRVFITKDLSDVHSTNTIFQLMSRAGRIGKSWIAEAFIDDSCAERIINSSMNNNDTVETDNINKCYNMIVAENTARDNKIIEEIKQKIAEEDRLKRLEEDRLRHKITEEVSTTPPIQNTHRSTQNINFTRQYNRQNKQYIDTDIKPKITGFERKSTRNK